MSAKQSAPPNDADVDECTRRIREQLKYLRLDDMASLSHAHAHSGVIGASIGWVEQAEGNLKHFLQYLYDTWGDVYHTLWRHQKLDLQDAFAVLYFATGASLVLIGIFIWCLLSTSPVLVWLYTFMAGKSTGGLSLVNAGVQSITASDGMCITKLCTNLDFFILANPNIFRNLTQEQSNAAKKKLSEQPDPKGHNPRTFDLDVAKMLLQISSLMYERSNEAAKETIKEVHAHIRNNKDDTETLSRKTSGLALAEPGQLLASLVGHENVSSVLDKHNDEDGEDAIHEWAHSYDVCYEPVSELSSLSQAYCSLFWEKKGKWVVVAFKGTDPRSFEEWSTDFTARFEDISADIPGFKYDTILAAVKIVCDDLVTINAPGTKINVWFTGHSLGTAIASLAYAKSLVHQDLLGGNALLRDAYLYATPITTDICSRNAFNEALFADRNVPRTMWRVTNRNDFVATGLPSLGDNPNTTDLDPENLFGFAHLGVEVFMKSRPHPCEIKGTHPAHIPFALDVHIGSSFTHDEVVAQREAAIKAGKTVAKIHLMMQDVPVIGRLAAHASTNYFDQLDQIAIGGCVDRDRAADPGQ
ncbi:hypothetical protein FRB98_002271 [Tulasnella sp. 332]|nr:hypothetical protein FRB98_002271 [Tulasnella sp. 332]